MQFIKHRVNSIKDLRDLRPGWGAEIDLRSIATQAGRIILAHDPWTRGDFLEDWLDEFCLRKLSGTVILNTKEDGLEERAIMALQQRKMTNFFFLDTTLPTLVRWTIRDARREFAVRLSAFEPPELADKFAGRAQWLWLDCFEGTPMPIEQIESIARKFRVCLVSPELHGKAIESVGAFEKIAPVAAAICTKFPDKWLELFNAKLG